MSSRAVKLAIAGVAAAMSLAVVSVPVEAAATAVNEKTQFISQYPTINMPVSCTTRSIYLASGTYEWRTGPTFGPGDWYDRFIYLGAAWYTWQDCLIPFDGYYEHTSTLLPPASTGWPGVTEVASPVYPHLLGWGGHVSWRPELVPQYRVPAEERRTRPRGLPPQADGG